MPSATTAAPTGPAPYCAVADVLTPNSSYDEYVRTYLDWTYRLSDTYVPPDLVNAGTGRPYITPRAVEAVGAAEVLARRGDPSYSTLLSDAPNAAVRSLVYAALGAMRAAALAAGQQLVILSAYRSYALQVQTFDYWTQVGGYQQALRTSARPGHSEHQLGTAIDFGDGSAAPWEYADWATTPAGAWLAAHAAEFGFVMSFPKGKTNVTCYDYEPWHYRYVGKALAQSLGDSRATLREYQSSALR
jgi:D-alanyl-D-alanine carboxypeptidase